MDEFCRSLPSVHLHLGCTVTEAEQTETSAHIIYTDPEGNRQKASARYIVGCDGANSTIRRIMNPTVTDLGFSLHWLVVDVIMKEPRVWNPLNLHL
jgi:2-polyprenyl-6-methoxyphenol hydroxylase-like FAD-dependent oxidoreductase